MNQIGQSIKKLSIFQNEHDDNDDDDDDDNNDFEEDSTGDKRRRRQQQQQQHGAGDATRLDETTAANLKAFDELQKEISSLKNQVPTRAEFDGPWSLNCGPGRSLVVFGHLIADWSDP